MYSTGYVCEHSYIEISSTRWSDHWWFTYYVNGGAVLHGSFNAQNLNEAEQIVVLKVREELAWRAERYSKMLTNFDKELNESENLL